MKTLSPVQRTEKVRKACVTLAKKICREWAGNQCVHCRRTKRQGWQMHGSHIYPEGVYKSMSADVMNILCLCARCHTGGFWKNNKEKSWHEDIVYFADWFERRYPERYVYLKERSRQSVSLYEGYWQEKLKLLKLMDSIKVGKRYWLELEGNAKQEAIIKRIYEEAGTVYVEWSDGRDITKTPVLEFISSLEMKRVREMKEYRF